MKTENLFSSEKKFDFEKVCFLLKDKDFFLKVISVLKERSIFSKDIWQYALYHKHDISLIGEFFHIVHSEFGLPWETLQPMLKHLLLKTGKESKLHF